MPIPGYPDYWAHPSGKIYSDKSKRFLSSGMNNGGRLHVGLPSQTGPRKYKTTEVAPLVCAAFHGPRPEGLVVSHLNGNAQDNRAKNLIWETHSENMRRKVGHDTSDAGHRNTRAVLTPEMVDTMFVLYQEQRKTMREIAEMFSVSRTTVSRTLHGQRYTTRAVSEVYSAHDRGTHAVNPRYGEDNPRSKLTKAQAEAIRADSRPRREVAAEYGISLTHVTGKNWSV